MMWDWAVVGIQSCCIDVVVAVSSVMPDHGVAVDFGVSLITGVIGDLEFCPGGDFVSIDVMVAVSVGIKILPKYSAIPSLAIRSSRELFTLFS